MKRKITAIVVIFAAVCAVVFLRPNTSDQRALEKTISVILYNEKALGKSAPTMDELLTLRRVKTGYEPEIAGFELPISYDVLTKRLDSLWLFVDSPPDGSVDKVECQQGCERATNGDCLLLWNTAFSAPGKHSLQAQLSHQSIHGPVEIRGPVLSFVSTNICQFEIYDFEFIEREAILHATLSETNATFTIEIKTQDGATHIKTLTGSTTNGVINVSWNMMDDNGKLFTNASFEAFFTVTLSDSKRSQTEKKSYCLRPLTAPSTKRPHRS